MNTVALCLVWVAVVVNVQGQVIYQGPEKHHLYEEHVMKAEGGDATAQYLLGVMYDEGRVVVRSESKAKEWFEKAAAQGDADAQNTMGVLYEEGRGVEQSYSKAKKWYEKAAAQGHAYAQNNLGLLYKNGQGVKQSDSKAKKWFDMARPRLFL